METLRLIGLVLMIILVILTILTIKLIGFEIQQKKISRKITQMDEQINSIENKTDLSNDNS